MSEFVGKPDKRRTVAIDKIGKFFEQIVGEGGTRMNMGERLSIFITDYGGNQRDGAGFPLFDSFRSCNGIQVLTGLLCKRIQFSNLLPNGGQLRRAVRRHDWSAPSLHVVEQSEPPR